MTNYLVFREKEPLQMALEGVVTIALNQLGANSRKPRDIESLRPAIY